MKIESKTLFKGVFLVIIVLTIFTRATSADLFVTQVAGNNRLTSTTLDFSNRETATNNPSSVLFNVSGFIAGGFEVRGVRVKKDGREDFRYRITTVKTAGDDSFCRALELTVLQDWQIKYKGDLPDFVFDSVIGSGGLDDWIFYLRLAHNESSLINRVCDFNFVFKTYRDDPGKSTGFWDEEVLSNHIFSGTWTP